MKLIVLDRDGVINQDSDAYVKSLDEWIPLPGAIEAIAALSRAGWTVTVATNQSGLARGYYSEQTLDAMHNRLRELVAAAGGELDVILHCPHGPEADCACRKPRPGMFQSIAERFQLTDLAGVPVVGDSLRDLEAGIQLGCTPYLVRTGKGEKAATQPLPAGTLIFDDLAAVAEHLLKG